MSLKRGICSYKNGEVYGQWAKQMRLVRRVDMSARA